MSHLVILPWGLYNLKNNNKYIETSSNMGHVLILGLGQLPNNLWGITPKDGDPIFNQMIHEKFYNNVKSTDVEVNDFLKGKFMNLITDNPLEYIKKVIYASKLYFMDPFYIGNLDNFRMNSSSYISDLRSAESSFYDLNLKDGFIYLKKTLDKVNTLVFIKIIVSLLTKLIGYLIIILTIYSIAKNFRKIISNVQVFILFLIIIYQFLISVFAFHMPAYTTSIYLIFVFLLSHLKYFPLPNEK